MRESTPRPRKSPVTTLRHCFLFPLVPRLINVLVGFPADAHDRSRAILPKAGPGGVGIAVRGAQLRASRGGSATDALGTGIDAKVNRVEYRTRKESAALFFWR